MKIFEAAAFALLSVYSALADVNLDFTLPDGVTYKLEETIDIKVHLFHIEKEPDDSEGSQVGLPTLMIFEIPKEKFDELSSEYEGKTVEEIESIAKDTQTAPAGIQIKSVTYKSVSVSGFEGHRLTTRFTLDTNGTTLERITQSNLLKNNRTYWMANGISLWSQNHLNKLDEIFENLSISNKQVEIE